MDGQTLISTIDGRRQVLDDRNVRRRFRASSMTTSTKVGRLACNLPLKLTDGWNDIQINLSELTQRLYATQYVEATRLQVRQPPALLVSNQLKVLSRRMQCVALRCRASPRVTFLRATA